ncbi:MAG: hypothetical protein ACOCUR_00845 [Nanoarchaeota archaeon]
MEEDKKFKDYVMDFFDTTIKGLAKDNLFRIIKPVVNLAKPELQWLVEKKPEEAYEWLKKAREQIDEAIRVYENDNRP